MTSRIRTFVFLVASQAAIFPLTSTSLVAQDIGPAPADATTGDFSAPPVPEGMEVLTRGVVHEAFAEVVTDPKPGLVVSKKPPEAIDEVPPEFKPDEEGAIWISGYWVWDDERDDFFWQSGVWRVPPPGMRWVAGYWNAAPGGWQWVSGFWVPVETEEVRYYDAPPASLEAGPTSPSPGDNFFWATGSWNNYDTGYRWQPGYWAPYQENWVWISPRHVWTPAGYVFLPGRWDYRMTRRGCLFAPVYFSQPIYTRPNYVYRPWCALNTSNLFVHLWVRPNYGHFYFGNYYGSNWNNRGVTPWCQYRPYRNCYDPMLTQLQVHYRQQGVNYIDRLDGWHNHYVGHVSSRPARTWNEQVRIVNSTNIHVNKTNITQITNNRQNILAVNLQDVKRRNEMPMKFAHLDGKMQKQAIDLAKETRDVRQHRMSVERSGVNLPDLAKGNSGKREVARPDLGKTETGKLDLDPRGSDKPGQRPGKIDQIRLKLPSTQFADTSKQREKFAPAKLTGPTTTTKPQVELPGNLTKNRVEGRSAISGSKAKSFNPMSKVELPGELPQTDVRQQKPKVKPSDERKKPEPRLPRPQPQKENPGVTKLQVETPKPQPKLELPQPKPQPQLEVPKPKRQPKVDIPQPKPQPRLGIPQPKLDVPRPKVEIPQPRPQPKLETPKPKPQPKLDVPRPKVEKPQIKLDIPRPRAKPESTPGRSGENKPQSNRKKPK